MLTIITGHERNSGTVRGVHGGEGEMGWVRLATGAHLDGDWDGIEIVRFAPGGHAGLHTHSQTEEIWYFLSGEGRMLLDDEWYEVRAGTLVLTPLSSSHAMWNTGEEDIRYVVIEVFPPAITRLLPQRRRSDHPSTAAEGA